MAENEGEGEAKVGDGEAETKAKPKAGGGDDGKSLWTNPERNRFFLLPDAEAEIAKGSYVVRNLFGSRREVAEAALGPFEVTQADADARIKAKVSGAIEATRQAVTAMFQRRPGAAATATGEPSPVRRDVEAIAGGLRDLFSGLGGALADVVHDLPRQPVASGATAPVDAEHASPTMGDGPAPRPDTGQLESALRAAAARLESFADALRKKTPSSDDAAPPAAPNAAPPLRIARDDDNAKS